jgi:GNAT superfamily N-acetyltransferase
MRLVHAHLDQLDEILEIYRHATRKMNEQGITQWADDYPSEELVKDDIQKRNLYALLDEERVAAVVVLDQEYEDAYEKVSWSDQSGRFLVVHRLCVNPAIQGRGVSRILMGEIERFAKEHGYTSIRLDTQIKNEKAMRLYMVNEYEQKGIIYLRGSDDPHMAFEKQLD